MLAEAAPATAKEQLGIVVTASPSLSVDRASLTATSLGELAPPAVGALAKLRQHPELGQRRKQARALLIQAAKLVRQVAYADALTQLDAAERLAIDGLAKLVEPRLLASIHFERGIALLPSDLPTAKRELLDSFALWPEGVATERMEEFAPRIETLIRQAQQAAAAKQQRYATMTAAEAQQVCLQADLQLLLVAELELVAQGKQEQLTVRLFDAGLRSWRWSEKARWPAGSHASTLPPRIVEAMRARFAEPAPKEESPTTTQRSWPWIVVGGLAVASAGVATVFGLLASDRESQAEALAGQQVAYEPQVADLEAEGELFERVAIVAWIAAGALATTAAVGLLWPRGESKHAPKSRATLLIAPSAVSVTVSWD